MALVHMTAAEVARDLPAVLEKVQHGTEVIVEHNDRPIAVIKSPEQARRTISETIALVEKCENNRAGGATLDPDFATDVQDIVRDRKPWHPRFRD